MKKQATNDEINIYLSYDFFIVNWRQCKLLVRLDRLLFEKKSLVCGEIKKKSVLSAHSNLSVLGFFEAF